MPADQRSSSADRPAAAPAGEKGGLVVVLDDDPMVLTGLDRLLSGHGYEVRTYANSADFLALDPPARPCCVILDNELDGTAMGLEVYAEIQRREWPVSTIFLTAHWDVSIIVEAVRNGAEDFLTKPFDPADLLVKVAAAIETARKRLIETNHGDESRRRTAQLSPREREIVCLVASGMLNKEIADQLDLALVTIKVHRSRAMRKLGAENTADLVRIATRAGLAD